MDPLFQTGPPDLGAADVREEPKEGSRDGAADQESAGDEGKYVGIPNTECGILKKY